MKPLKSLILILLSVFVAEAQSPAPMAPGRLAEAARTERGRRAKTPLVGRVYTTDEARRGTVAPLAITSPAPPVPPAPPKTEIAFPVPKLGAPADPVKEWNDQVVELRAKVRELQDRHDAFQLQVAQFTDQYLAPVTDTNSQQNALAKLVDAQKKMDETAKDLSTAQNKLKEMEKQGPPKK